MSFPAYKEYKSCEIGWLDRIPSAWSISPLLAIAKECDEPNNGMIEDNLLSLSYGEIVRKDIAANDGLLPESFETYQVVNEGDIVLRLTDLQNDKRSLRTGLVRERGIITSAYTAIRPVGLSAAYMAFLLRAYDLFKVFYSMGGGLRQSMKFADLKRLPILLPPMEEQSTIVAFLDREIGKIDALVVEQEKLITLLREKRQAVISHAVTKGLDPSAPMKDSGIEWLGDIPAHWEVSPLKRIIAQESSISYGVVQPGEHVDDGVPFVQTTNMSNGTFELEELQRTTEEISNAYPRSKLTGGEVLLGIRASIGAAHVAPLHLRGANLSRGVARIECGENVKAAFLVSYLKATAVEQYWQISKQGSTFNEVSIATVRELPAVLPPVPEQEAIAHATEENERGFSELEQEARRAIDLLKEYRSALISAAVTGKIDVRQVQSVEAA